MEEVKEKPVRSEQIVSVCVLVSQKAAEVESLVRRISTMARLNARYVEILVIDNHAEDPTRETLGQLQQSLPDIRSLRLSRVHHPEQVLAAALDHSIGDAVVILRAGIDSAELFPVVLSHLAAGVQVVMGEAARPRRSLAAGFTSLADQTITTDGTAFCLGLSRQALNALTRIRSKSRRIAMEAPRLGFPTVTIRTESKVADEVGFFERLQILVAYSLQPLRFAALLGLTASFLNLVYLGYILCVALVKQRIAEGWLTTSLTHTTMSFLQFVILAILAEYIGRILEESKDQPQYFIEGETVSVVSSISPDRLNVAGEVGS